MCYIWVSQYHSEKYCSPIKLNLFLFVRLLNKYGDTGISGPFVPLKILAPKGELAHIHLFISIIIATTASYVKYLSPPLCKKVCPPMWAKCLSPRDKQIVCPPSTSVTEWGDKKSNICTYYWTNALYI